MTEQARPSTAKRERYSERRAWSGGDAQALTATPEGYTVADYALARDILRSNCRRELARQRSKIAFGEHTIALEQTFRTDPGRARVRLDDDTAVVVRQVTAETSRSAPEEGSFHTPPTVGSARSSTAPLTSSLKKTSSTKKSVSFGDRSPKAKRLACHGTLDITTATDVASMREANDSGPRITSPIHAACYKGDYLVLKHLLSYYFGQESDKLVNSLCACGMTPLQVACEQGHARIVKLLLRCRADPNKRGKKRHRSCITMACMSRNRELLDLLLAHGAVVDEEALITSCSQGHGDMVELMTTYRQKRSLSLDLRSQFLHKRAPLPEIEAAIMNKAAAVAITYEHPEMVGALLGDGKSTISKRRVAECAVDAAQHGNYKLLRVLIKQYDHELVANAKDSNTQGTLLHHVVPLSCMNSVVLLIRLGVDVNARDARGITPLYIACARGYTSIVRVLLHAGALCAAMGPNDETPLHIAAQENHYGCVELLLSHGKAPVDALTLDHCTALHLACQRGNTRVAECLLDHGADVDAQTTCCESALVKASRMSHAQTVKLLLARNAKPVEHDSVSAVETSSSREEPESELDSKSSSRPPAVGVQVKSNTHASLKRWFRTVIKKQHD
ncbi:TPA: hypothetical protein N0F65_008168 [Lagenidium giganteum]|uniref:Ankyrin repeat protein n=1 Tax=Lagenidium giganteum TaxID=4803 RepID=A0AAV2YN26_9STRA|nr:TPA: hypothetical protein N0F65_008168 [Lagenidium giganteum]